MPAMPEASPTLPFSPRDLLVEWLSIDATTGAEPVLLEVVETFLRRSGWHPHRQPVVDDRYNLLVTPTHGEPVPLLFSTHVDTVPPFFGPRVEHTERGERIRARGACDTRGGLVAMLAAMTRLRASGHPVGLLLVVGEEVDHCGAIAATRLAPRLCQGPTALRHIVLCEPTRNRLVTHQKGLLKVRVQTRGIAGHSAFPEQGESAVDKLLDLLAAVRAEPWPSHDALGPTTVNIGLLSGGVAANVFAPSAEATLMFRLAAPASAVLQRVRALAADVEADVEVLTFVDPQTLHVPPGEWPTTIARFNSDAVHLAELAPVTMVGPGDIAVAHGDDEHIDVADLEAGIELYVRLAEALLAPGAA